MNTNHKYIALCPSCGARLPMNDSHMDIAKGNIRCGKCDTAFYAPDNLVQGNYSPSNNQLDDGSLYRSEAMQFELAEQQDTHIENSSYLLNTGPSPEAFTPTDDDYVVPEPKKTDPTSEMTDTPNTRYRDDQIISHESTRFIRKQPAGRKIHGKPSTSYKKWLLIVAGLVMLVLLALQLLAVNVSSWSHHPLMRGIYSQICTTFLCELPVDLKPVSLNIEIAGYRRMENGSYQIKGLLTNWAYYSQKLPVIRIFFVNLTETETFAKSLTPQEYLAASSPDKTSIASEERIEFSVTVDDMTNDSKYIFPRMEVVSY